MSSKIMVTTFSDQYMGNMDQRPIGNICKGRSHRVTGNKALAASNWPLGADRRCRDFHRLIQQIVVTPHRQTRVAGPALAPRESARMRHTTRCGGRSDGLNLPTLTKYPH